MLTIDHAHSYTNQGTRWIDIDPGKIMGIRFVHLHPEATHTEGIEILLAPHGYSEVLAMSLPLEDWHTIRAAIEKNYEEADPTATAPGT